MLSLLRRATHRVISLQRISHKLTKMNESFGKRLARLRAEKAMTQRDLASKAGISWSQIFRYESDLAQPRLKVLMKLAEAVYQQL